jgi:hypothetical protein
MFVHEQRNENEKASAATTDAVFLALSDDDQFALLAAVSAPDPLVRSRNLIDHSW